MSSIKFRLRGSFLAVLAVGLVWIGCTDKRADLTSPADLGPNILVVDQVALSHAIRVQEAHTDEMFEIAGVVGTAVGLSESGRPVVKVYLMTDQVEGVPVNVDGVPFVPEISGEILALQIGQAKGSKKGGRPKPSVDRTATFGRPVPIGVSTGHPNITAGTIGARVIDGNGNVYALSNNHVYADQNYASIGDAVIQPGTFDGGSLPADYIGTLSDYQILDFNGGDNVIDAAIALSSTEDLGNATPSDGYGVPPTNTIDAAVGHKVKKYGRTTGLTSGRVDAINATLNVGYGTGVVARFVQQIIITPGDFSAGGDSGSLILVTTVTGRGKNKSETVRAVGLLFAGSQFLTVANPITSVLNRFGVTIDGNDQN